MAKCITKDCFFSDVFPYILVLASPFLACLILFVCTGSSLLHYDAFNTVLNDELGYYHNVRMIRIWGSPEGYTGYNEVLAPMHGYGPYNFVTYMPYVLLSFLTGIESHNFMLFCNIILIAVALAALVRLCEMNLQQSMIITIFLSSFLILDYYIFSGMTEAAHVAFMFAVFGMMFKLYISQKEMVPKKEELIIWIATLLIIFFGIIRPYELVFLLFPFIYVMSKKNARAQYVIITVTLALFAILLYFYMANNYCSPYFVHFDGMSEYVEYLKNGKIVDILSDMVFRNYQSMDLLKYIRIGSWNSAVLASFFCLQLLTAVFTYVKWKKTGVDRGIVFNSILLFASVAIYESNVLLYTATNFDRILLGITSTMGLSLGIQMNGLYRITSFAPTVCITLAMILVLGGNTLVLPQESDQYNGIDDSIRGEFETVMPMTDDPWNQTIAFEPAFSDMYLMYLFPSYMGMQCCTTDYLLENISGHSMKSKYIWAKHADYIDDACQNAGLSQLWTNGEWCIYATR